MFVRPFGDSGVACDGKHSSHVQINVVPAGGSTEGARRGPPHALLLTRIGGCAGAAAGAGPCAADAGAWAAGACLSANAAGDSNCADACPGEQMIAAPTSTSAVRN